MKKSFLDENNLNELDSETLGFVSGGDGCIYIDPTDPSLYPLD